VDAIADFIHITQTNGSSANNACLDRAASAPASTGWLLARSISSNVLGGIMEDGWRHVQHAVRRATGRSVFGSVADRRARRIGDAILI
jgi:hypothetical protein